MTITPSTIRHPNHALRKDYNGNCGEGDGQDGLQHWWSIPWSGFGKLSSHCKRNYNHCLEAPQLSIGMGEPRILAILVMGPKVAHATFDLSRR